MEHRCVGQFQTAVKMWMVMTVVQKYRLTRIEKAVKKRNYNYNIQGVSVYTNVSANYMFRPLLVRLSSGWIP